MKASSLWAAGRIVLASGFVVAVAYALGRWFLRLTGAWKLFTRAERPLFAFAIGSAWLSSLVFLVCVAQLAYPAVFAVAGVVVLWVGLRGPAQQAPPAEPGWRIWPLAPVAACYAYLYLIHAMAPETSPDGAGYHLGLVSRYLREHGFSRITTNVYAMLSQGAEMLFLFAFAFGRHSAAKMTHLAFLAATVVAMLGLGRRFRLAPEGVSDSAVVAAVAAAFFAISPVVGVDGASSYNDCALALFTFLTFYLLLLWEESRDPALLPAIGVAAGFCYSIKYTGFLALPFALVVVGRDRILSQAALKRVVIVALFASLFIAPWMIKNAIIVQNPLAPFFNQWFPNPYVHFSFERDYKYLMRHYGGLAEQNWREYLAAPWELAVAGGKLQGLLGPLFLLSPLGLWSLRRRMGRRLWMAAAIFALPWFSNMGTRFLIPSLAFISLAMAVALWQLPRKMAVALAAVLVAAHAVGSWPSVVDRWNHRGAWRLTAPPWRAALRLQPESEYLSRQFPDYNVAQMIDRTVSPGERVLAITGVTEAYIQREVIGGYQSALGEVLTDHLLAPFIDMYTPGWNIRLEWEALDLSGLRLLQTASHDTEQWGMHEMLLYSGEAYVKPRSSWLLRATPNPWDAAMAMDGNPVTRWRSWWPLYSGMQYQVDFPEPLRLSAVDIRTTPDQHTLRLEVQAKDPSGRWAPLKATRTLSAVEPPRDIMKRLAASELKERGIDYLLATLDGDGLGVIGRAIDQDPGAWGMTRMGEYGPVRLYYIE